MHFFEFGAAVRDARTARGLTQSRLAEMAGLSRVTVNQIENGAASDIGVKKMTKLMALVGLSLAAAPKPARLARDFLTMACTSANVSFKNRMGPDDLATVLLSGRVPADFKPHLRVVLEELPRSVLEGVVRQVGRTRDVAAVKVNLAKVAKQIGSSFKVIGPTP